MGTFEDWKQYGLFLLPLRDVHANAVDISEDDINFQKFDKRYTDIFIALGSWYCSSLASIS